MKRILPLLTILFIEFSASAQFAKILDFKGTTNGAIPFGSLLSDGAFLYGTTLQGGTTNVGTIFKIMPNGSGYTKLLDFDGPAYGVQPYSGLISDSTYLYGTAEIGGIYGYGTVYKIKKDGTGFTKLLDFDGTNPTTYGYSPRGSLIFDSTFLYGTTERGGGSDNVGTIFKVKKDGSGSLKLFDFDISSGSNPQGALLSIGSYLYGTTFFGGLNTNGTLFKVLKDGTGFTKLLDFSGSTDGANPNGSLIYDGTFLYGMTVRGGIFGKGVVFKIKPDGTDFSKLLDFNGLNGENPYGDLLSDGTFLYGLTSKGGPNGYGVIFKIKPDGTGFVKMRDLNVSSDGMAPKGSLIAIGNVFYGTTTDGGSNNLGTMFKYTNSSTGTSSQSVSHGTSISPNPFSSYTVIRTDQPLLNATVTIYNLFGQPVTVINNISGHETTIPNDNLPVGIYLLRLTEGNKLIATERIVVSN